MELDLINLPHEVSQYTPEWAYIETGIDPDVIRETAREMARYKPSTLMHPGRHATWYGDDAQRSRAIALLNALTWKLGKKRWILCSLFVFNSQISLSSLS